MAPKPISAIDSAVSFASAPSTGLFERVTSRPTPCRPVRRRPGGGLSVAVPGRASIVRAAGPRQDAAGYPRIRN